MSDEMFSTNEAERLRGAVAAINEAGTACLMAESEVSMLRLTGHTGRRIRESEREMKAAYARLAAVFDAAGLAYDELAALTNGDGTMALEYGVAEVLDHALNARV